MPIDLGQLKTFVTVAEEQHLTRAADRLAISQSGASAHIRALEERLGTQLFIRANRSMELTRAGELLLQKAKDLLNKEAQLASYARELTGKIEGKLSVGSSSDPGTRIGEILAKYRANHPLVRIDVSTRPSSSARQGLKTGELDVAVLLGGALDAGCTCYTLETMNYRIAGPVEWKEKIEAAGWPELASLPWLKPGANSAYSSVLHKLFGARGLELNSVIHFDNVFLGRALLQAGAGMMLLRENHALLGEKEGYLALAPIGHSEVTLSIALQTSRKDDPLIRAFVDAASQVWPDMRVAPGPDKPAGAERSRPG